jgi:glycosyltransferase involved in cell wall biosynthesis
MTQATMTAALTPGDAISNYALSCSRILQQEGVRVYLYADHVDPVYVAIARHSRYYPATRIDILWFHYSMWESFCVPVAESLYFGVPAAVHNVPPLPEVAGPGGIVIDKQTLDRAAQAILAVLNEPNRYARWPVPGQKDILTKYRQKKSDLFWG